MMNKFLTFSLNTTAFALLSVCALTSAHAASVDPAETSIDEQATEETTEETTGSWDEAGESAADAWEATKEASSDTWEATKKSSAKAWGATKEFSSDAWDATKEFSVDTWEATKDWFDGSEAEAPVTEPQGEMSESQIDEPLPNLAPPASP